MSKYEGWQEPTPRHVGVVMLCKVRGSGETVSGKVVRDIDTREYLVSNPFRTSSISKIDLVYEPADFVQNPEKPPVDIKLLDHFAGLAMQGLVAAGWADQAIQNSGIAEQAYTIAKMMLEEREKHVV